MEGSGTQASQPRAQERWESHKPPACPGVAVGRFANAETLSYAVLLVAERLTFSSTGYRSARNSGSTRLKASCSSTQQKRNTELKRISGLLVAISPSRSIINRCLSRLLEEVANRASTVKRRIPAILLLSAVLNGLWYAGAAFVFWSVGGSRRRVVARERT